MLLSELVTNLMKTGYDRVRPPDPLVHTTGASFPSGHAVATAVTAVALVIALVPTGRQRALWGSLAALFAFLMALSRAYLEAHWLSDAVEGNLIGIACAMLTAVVVEALRERRERREQREEERQPWSEEKPAPA
jgi:undecaprenyl-diphosphatase